MASGGSPTPGGTSLTSLATSLTDIPMRPKPSTKYTQRPSRLTKTQPPPLKTATRSIPVSSAPELPKSRILPTARNISIFSSLGTACIIACIALVLLKHVSIWITLAASFCGVLGAALYIEVALLVSARFRCKILDEECTIADMIEAKEDRRRRGLSWDLRGIGKKAGEEGDTEKSGSAEERRHSTANQGLKGGPPSMTNINEGAEEEEEEEEEDYDEKDVTIEVAIQKPVPVATSFPVHRI
ncbi:hypothetical protein TWF730_011035 [Orbilia blumenaviensis]|uniref:Uncharacterized protein n=1 Tax=Orbilia blumenaviensis TaxID=1796055 RepID=A0AAV9UQF0_9PEZI